MPKTRLAASSIMISSLTVLSGLFSYLALVILASSFGTRTEMDAFFAATTIPQIVLTILLGPFSYTFVPVFVDAMIKNEARAWKAASVLSNFFFLILGVLALAGILFSRRFILLANPGFTDQTAALSGALFRFFLASMVVSGLAGVLKNVYFANHKFFWPCLTQVMNTLLTLLFVLFMRRLIGIHSIAVGTFAGSLLQFFLLLPLFLKEGRYFFVFDFRNREVLSMTRLALPLLAGSLLYKTNGLVERFLASRLGEGPISYLGYANRIIMAIYTALTMGLSTALLPEMSKLKALGDTTRLKDMLSKSIRGLMMISLPLSAFIIVTRHDLVKLIFERGSFTPQATFAVGNTLAAYIGILLTAMVIPIVSALYSLQETMRVAVVSVISFMIYLGLAFALADAFGYVGIAVATSIQFGINLPVLAFILKRKLGSLDPNRTIAKCLLKTAGATAISTFIVLVIASWLNYESGSPVTGAALGLFGLLTCILWLYIFRTDELRWIIPHLPLSREKNYK